MKLSNIILSNDYDIICLSETWLTENIPDNALFLPAHIITRCDRPTNSTKSKHGGVLIAVKQSLAFTKLEIHTTDCVGLLLNTPTPLILCCIYSAPNESKYKLSTDDFNKLLNMLTDFRRSAFNNSIACESPNDFEKKDHLQEVLCKN